MTVVKHLGRAIVALEEDLRRLDRRRKAFVHMRAELLTLAKLYQSGRGRRSANSRKTREISNTDRARIRRAFGHTKRSEWPAKAGELAHELGLTHRQVTTTAQPLKRQHR